MFVEVMFVGTGDSPLYFRYSKVEFLFTELDGGLFGESGTVAIRS